MKLLLLLLLLMDVRVEHYFNFPPLQLLKYNVPGWEEGKKRMWLFVLLSEELFVEKQVALIFRGVNS